MAVPGVKSKTAAHAAPATPDPVAVTEALAQAFPTHEEAHRIVEAVEADPWADVMTSTQLVPAFTRGPRVDIEKDIPGLLRTLFETSLGEYFREIALSNGTKLPENSTKYREFDTRTQERAVEFINYAHRWAKYRRVDGEPNDGQVSARAFQVTGSDKQKTTVVRFAVMPLSKKETRRAPGTTADPNTPKIREWAKAQGLQVTERGRLSEDVRKKYNEAHPAPVAETQTA